MPLAQLDADLAAKDRALNSIAAEVTTSSERPRAARAWSGSSSGSISRIGAPDGVAGKANITSDARERSLKNSGAVLHVSFRTTDGRWRHPDDDPDMIERLPDRQVVEKHNVAWFGGAGIGGQVKLPGDGPVVSCGHGGKGIAVGGDRLGRESEPGLLAAVVNESAAPTIADAKVRIPV